MNSRTEPSSLPLISNCTHPKSRLASTPDVCLSHYTLDVPPGETEDAAPTSCVMSSQTSCEEKEPRLKLSWLGEDGTSDDMMDLLCSIATIITILTIIIIIIIIIINIKNILPYKCPFPSYVYFRDVPHIKIHPSSYPDPHPVTSNSPVPRSSTKSPGHDDPWTSLIGTNNATPGLQSWDNVWTCDAASDRPVMARLLL
ncbi:hypothetical protein ElyMa_000594100 [Elysia marginata]|uniref:Uncharacterized protein n=1 Tax=Elysia marginata TaxID=1093978 RepID=A0AAV4G8Z7_9GAST|nr:hypothetical protein ElyMa_000594100 [Elysia marginata]